MGTEDESDAYYVTRAERHEIEEGKRLVPKFNTDGVMPVVTTDAHTGDVLMLAYMNQESLARTIATKEAWYWSRSRKELWHKGATSGLTQKVVSLGIDCDQDALWMKVEVQGAGCCHVGYKSCFFREIPLGASPTPELQLNFVESKKAFDPAKVYGK